MSKIPKKLIKKLNSKKAQYTEVETKAYFLWQQLGEGITLEMLAAKRGVPYSELMEEIQEEPRLIQAVADGKKAGEAYWQKRIIKMIDDGQNVNGVVFKTFIGNYMKWWDRPIEEDFDENTVVNIYMEVRKPTKKEKAGMKLAKEMAI